MSLGGTPLTHLASRGGTTPRGRLGHRLAPVRRTAGRPARRARRRRRSTRASRHGQRGGHPRRPAGPPRRRGRPSGAAAFSGGQRQRLVLARALSGGSRGAGARRADLRRRRPHRGPDRGPAARAPRRPHHGRGDQQPADARRSSTRWRSCATAGWPPPAPTLELLDRRPGVPRAWSRARPRRTAPMRISLPDRRRPRRPSVRRRLSPAATRGCCGARSRCTPPPPWPRWRHPGCWATSSSRSRAGRPPARSTGSCCCSPPSWSLQTVLTRYARYSQPGARRAGAGRAPRGLRRQRPRPAGRGRRVGRLRRPAHPHQPRRRPARLVGPARAARVDDRRGDGGADLRRGAARSGGGWCSRACWACRRW